MRLLLERVRKTGKTGSPFLPGILGRTGGRRAHPIRRECDELDMRSPILGEWPIPTLVRSPRAWISFGS